MKSITELYRIGRGPSSSHTIAPERACAEFDARYPAATRFHAVLFGSFALTGTGHGTDTVIQKTFTRPTTVAFDTETETAHPNTMDLVAYMGDEEIGRARVISTGGGAYRIEGEQTEERVVYPLRHFSDIAKYCAERGMRLYQYVEECEGAAIWGFLDDIWTTMKKSIAEGLDAEGILPGGLQIERKAHRLYHSRHFDESPSTRENRIICAYAYAVGEQNASGEYIVTAPTCGASGVLPAVFLYMQQKHSLSDMQMLEGLATAGLIGNIIKHNASISGAECGCQAEIGSACSMAAGGLAELFDFDIDQIEYAAEIAMEHHLGLTCDPVCGLVQIPCIERNAVGATRALTALSLATFLTGTRKISFDMVVETMLQTGRDLSGIYRETAKGGLAKLYTIKK